MAVRVSVAFLLILSVVQASEPRSCECPAFWTRFGDNCYRFFGALKTWEEARSHCQEFFIRYGEGDLASVGNQRESNFLIKLWSTSLVPRDGAAGRSFWIGLNDVQQAENFVWSDGKQFDFTQWHKDEPNSSDEDCVQYAKWPEVDKVGWNDTPCSTVLPYICQISSV